MILVEFSDKKREKFDWIINCLTDLKWDNDISRGDTELDRLIGECNFPVLEGTPGVLERNTMVPGWADYFYNDVTHVSANYDNKCKYILEHIDECFSLHKLKKFILRESLKAFSPYSKPAKELFDKMEELKLFEGLDTNKFRDWLNDYDRTQSRLLDITNVKTEKERDERWNKEMGELFKRDC